MLSSVIITNPKVLNDFVRRHRDTDARLRDWKEMVRLANWKTPHEVIDHWTGVTILGDGRLIFNIKGNQYRLVAKVDYVAGTLEIRFIGTHASYDDINPKGV